MEPQMQRNHEYIELQAVQTNNLKGIDVLFPLGKITAVTGVSGSGKSSLVFDTLYGESYRRYVESLSSFARQYMKAMAKPDIGSVQNLPPAIAVKQVKSQSNARSTVGTATELYDLIRILYTHLSQPFCFSCGKPVIAHTNESIVKALINTLNEDRVLVTAKLDKFKGSKVTDLKKQLLTFGFVRCIVDSEIKRIEDMDAKTITDSSVIVDRLVVDDKNSARLLESVKTASQLSQGKVEVFDSKHKLHSFPTTRTCCGHTFRDPSTALFSFNHPFGACQTCQGFGAEATIDWDKVFPDSSSSVKELGVAPWNFGSHDEMYEWAKKSAKKNKILIGKSFSEYSAKEWQWLKFGTGEDDFSGVKGYFDWLNSKKHKAHLRIHAARYRKYETCSECMGLRLNKDSLSYKIDSKNIGEFCDRSLREIKLDIDGSISKLKKGEDVFGIQEALEEAQARLDYLDQVGLNYLTLNRQTRTLSGGEFQRINMARCLGSALTDTLYCLDEPTSGLHVRDGDRLMSVIKTLRDQGNTVVLVEHEKNIVKNSDFLIEIGPDAGHRGGEVTYSGDPKGAKKIKKSVKFASKLPGKTKFISFKGVSTHNLKNVNVSIPLNSVSVVCGVSGSGKTSLVQHSLYPSLAHALGQKKLDGYISETKVKTLSPKDLAKDLTQVIHVSQVTIGRSSRSTIATYLGIMNEVRKILAAQPSAKAAKLEARHFSFNTKGGRCETCCGLGTVIEDLSFLGEMTVECPDCHGKRFTDKVLQVKFREKNLNDILSLTVSQTRELFFDHKKLCQILDSISELGLGYMTLGQSTSSFSGGEGQRLKLLRLLQDALNSKPSFLIFDEPTTGLSDSDVFSLMAQFRGLVEKGHTVLIVEHHLDVIKNADWLIEVGPDAAEKGGEIVYEGPVIGLKEIENSITKNYLNWNENE